MRLYNVYKARQGQKIFIRQYAAVSDEVIIPNMPPLPEGEQYLAPELVTDRAAYEAAIEDAKKKAQDPHVQPDQTF